MGVWGGRSSIFSYIHMAWTIFRGSENEYFGGMKKLWIFLGGHYIPGIT